MSETISGGFRGDPKTVRQFIDRELADPAFRTEVEQELAAMRAYQAAAPGEPVVGPKMSTEQFDTTERAKEKLRPRWLAKLLANMGGYFWLPCPACGEFFAGFESGSYGAIPTERPGISKSVCADCSEKARRGSVPTGETQ